jgi:hypothetical protein
MVPPRKSFNAYNLIAGQVEHRLVVKLELTVRQCRTHIILEGTPDLHLHIHTQLEEVERPTAGVLRAVKCEVSVSHQLAWIAAIRWTDGDADTGADDDLMASDIVRLAYAGDDSLG